VSEQKVRARDNAGGRRRAILDQAQRIVGERGYHGFGLQELAERCGLTKPGLLHYFGSKDRLLIDLLRDRDAQHEAAAHALLDERCDRHASARAQRDSFVAGLRLIMERNAAQPELTRLQTILRAEAINGDHPAHGYFMGREAAKLDLLADLVAVFSPAPRSTARQVLALMGGLEEQWLREDRAFDLAAEFDAAIGLIIP